MELGVLFALFGGFMTWVAGFTLAKRLLPALRGRRRGVGAEGRVLRFKSSWNGVSTMHQPVVAFTTPDGRRVEFLDAVASPVGYRQPGALVSVRYDPADPANSATLAGDGDVARSVAIFSAMTVFFGGMTVLGLLYIVGVVKPK